jgi:hypothetical protein
MRPLTSAVSAFAFAVMAASLPAADVYVNNITGNDGTADGSLALPFATINAAISAAGTVAGDVIKIVNTGIPYTENVIVNKAGLVLEGVPSGNYRPIVRGIPASSRYTIFVQRNDTTIRGLQVHLVQDSVTYPSITGAYSNDRAAIFADDASGRAFNNLLVDDCLFLIESDGTSSWRHIGVRTYSTNGAVRESVTVNNSTFGANPVTAPMTPAVRTVNKDGKARYSKSVHGYGIELFMQGNDSEGYFRDVHIEIAKDLILQNNVFRNSVEVNSPDTTGLADGAEMRIRDNRFTGEYHYEHFISAVPTFQFNPSGSYNTSAADDQAGAVGYDPDYYGAFTTAISGYIGRIPQFVPGYQDELLFLKSNVKPSGLGRPPILIERNFFKTRRNGITVTRATNVLIKRNIFISDPSTDAPLPSPNPLGIAYGPKRHISIDKNWFLTCCSNSTLPDMEIDIVANYFLGADSVGVFLTDEMPVSGTPGGSPTPTGAGTITNPGSVAESINIVGNDFAPDMVAFWNDYFVEPQDLTLADNYFGPGGPQPTHFVTTPGVTGSTTNNDPATRTNVNDSDGDGLFDGEEIARYDTEPLLADTDTDDWADGLEVALRRFFPTQFDPLDDTKPGIAFVDVDGDGYPDNYDPDTTTADANNDRIKDVYAFITTLDAFGPVSLGDTNLDGQRTNLDAINILEVFLGIRTLIGTSSDYDLNRDGRVDNRDAIILYGWALNLLPYIPYP